MNGFWDVISREYDIEAAANGWGHFQYYDNDYYKYDAFVGFTDIECTVKGMLSESYGKFPDEKL